MFTEQWPLQVIEIDELKITPKEKQAWQKLQKQLKQNQQAALV